MQRGTRPRATSSVGSRDDTASVRSPGIRLNSLESPGDATPPGIQFTRGSFSEHLLPLDSPLSTRDDAHNRVAVANTPSPTLLRSPTRKRPPPAPTPVPRPPTTMASRARPTATSILMPRVIGFTRTPRPPPDKSAKETGPVMRPPTLTTEPQSPAIKTLDLSMEKKDAELDTLRGEIKQLHVQAEMQKNRQRSSCVSNGSRSVLKRPPTRAGGTTAAGGSRAGVPVQTAAASPAKQDSVEADAAMRRIEEALTDLRQCHQELLGFCASVPTGKEALTLADVQHEHQLYIRVLEEAVHLKASELCVTGHEELLVVLAELRHTIYQQEQEIGALQEQLNDVKSEHLECKTVRLEIEDKLHRETSKWEHELAASRQREVALQRQLEDVQRLAHTEHMRFREERATQDQQSKRIASLEQEQRARTQELRQWETTRSDSWAKKEATMAKEIDDLKASLEAERTTSLRTNETLATSQRQVDELKAMQEGLLQSIDQFVSKEDHFEQRIKQLEAEVETVHRLRQEHDTLEVSNAELHQELADIKRKNVDQQQDLTAFEAIERANEKINEAIDAKAAVGSCSAEDQVHESGFATLQVWIDVLQRVIPSIGTSQPWLSTLLEDLTACSSHAQDVVDECTQLKQSKTALQRSLEIESSELERFRADLLQAQTELMQSQLESQKLELRVATMDEEALEAQAQLHLREKLAEQIFEQENLLKTQQQRLQNALEQNNELVALEANLETQVTAKEGEVLELRARVQDYEHQQGVLRELEQELEDAAALAERQNAWNQQLTVELEHLELAKAEQDQVVETLEMRDEALTTNFKTLYSQYMQFVAANKQRLKDEYAIGKLQGSHPPSVHDKALASGDVFQMLRVFPTLVEEYLASVMLGLQDGKQTDVGRRSERAKQRAQVPRRFRALPNVHGENFDKKQQLDKGMEQDESEQFGAQLREISQAFSRFKSLEAKQ